VKRHLTPFKTVDRHTRAAGLTFLAATRGFPLARTDTAANPHPALAGTLVITDFVKFHVSALAFALFALFTAQGQEALVDDFHHMTDLLDHPADFG
jgi:hypothetical protein